MAESISIREIIKKEFPNLFKTPKDSRLIDISHEIYKVRSEFGKFISGIRGYKEQKDEKLAIKSYTRYLYDARKLFEEANPEYFSEEIKFASKEISFWIDKI